MDRVGGRLIVASSRVVISLPSKQTAKYVCDMLKDSEAAKNCTDPKVLAVLTARHLEISAVKEVSFSVHVVQSDDGKEWIDDSESILATIAMNHHADRETLDKLLTTSRTDVSLRVKWNRDSPQFPLNKIYRGSWRFVLKR